MPKQVLEINNFAGGLNAYSDARDIKDTEFVQNWNAVVSKAGIIKVSGMGKNYIATDYFPKTTNTLSRRIWFISVFCRLCNIYSIRRFFDRYHYRHTWWQQ